MASHVVRGLSVQMHPEMPNSKSDFHRTPRLEELASQGMRFSAAYSPSTVCAPIARGKGTVSEGGTRAPFIIRGPGIEPNSFAGVRMVGFDLFPTYAEWAGVEDLPENIEGGSIVSVLENGGVGEIDRPREQLVFHFPHYQSFGGPQTAVLLGDMKLIKYYETGETRLYNLRDDIGETTDLSQELPHKAAELEALMGEHLAAIGAQQPRIHQRVDLARRGGRRVRQDGRGLRRRGL